ncbi:hypothetical protein DFAR_3280013 [Desulfarculales bacterium]
MKKLRRVGLVPARLSFAFEFKQLLREPLALVGGIAPTDPFMPSRGQPVPAPPCFPPALL